MIAIVYARFSSNKQREESITAQLRAISEYTNKKGIKIIKEYIDEGKSATTDERPSFQRMFSEIKQLKPDLVLVHKLDRFARDRFDAAFYRREIQKAGAKLVAVDQPFDDSPESVLFEGIIEAWAEYYSKNLSREVMKGMNENAFKAKFNGGWVPLGYDIDSNKNYLVNEDEAITIRMIFNGKLNGKSYGTIISELNQQGRLTKKGKLFGKNAIYEILRNEKYCGTYVFNETPKRLFGKRNNRIKKTNSEIIRLENAIPAIISREEWKKVQEMMDERKNGPRERDNNVLYILTGILKCGVCGAAMVGNGSSKIVHGERKKYYYYQCNNNMRTHSCDNKKRYPKDKLESAILDQIQRRVIRPDNEQEFADKLWEEIRIINEVRDEEKTELKKQLQMIQRKIDNIIKVIEDGLYNPELGPKLNEQSEKKKHIENLLSERRSPFEGITRQDILNFFKKQKGKLIPKNDPEIRKNIVASYVKEATINNDNLDIEYKLELSCDSAGVGGGT
jgi:site-specific DNA recombinase